MNLNMFYLFQKILIRLNFLIFSDWEGKTHVSRASRDDISL
jgi:hypothetical protein